VSVPRSATYRPSPKVSAVPEHAPGRKRRVGARTFAAAAVALLAVLVAGVAAGRPEPADRAGALAARLRCPDCRSISVAESDSQTASAIREQIGRLLAEGRSDQEILDHFTARYGRWVLLDPPARGQTLLLWLLPALALTAGLAAVVRRRAPAAPTLVADPGDPRGRELLRERLAQAEQDLVELGAQVAAGEVDETTAAALGERYRAETAEARTALADLDGQDSIPPATVAPRGPAGRRVLAGAVLGVAALVGVGLAVKGALVPRPADGYVTGVDVADAAAGSTGAGGAAPADGRDLSKVSDAELEAVVAANPEVTGMRLALAHRYFDRGDYRRAMGHYRLVLERERNPVALSHVGWIAFIVGRRPDLAARLLDESLRRSPNDPEALWFLGNVQLSGLNDARAAVATLSRLERLPGLSATERDKVAELVRTARSKEGRP
jgi:cytochrome c-type biogenesis protein CcmH/NrfF